MKYCLKCILPDTRPGIKLNKDGICGGCLNNILQLKKLTGKKEKRFQSLIKIIKEKIILQHLSIVP